MTSFAEPWPQEFRVEIDAAIEWVERGIGAPAQFRQVFRNKLWGFTASFVAAEEHVVLKIASPPLFKAAHLLMDEGVSVLRVKTLSARRRDDGYEETRAFYRSLGSVHLEEHPTLWDESNPALQMIKVLSAPTP